MLAIILCEASILQYHHPLRIFAICLLYCVILPQTKTIVVNNRVVTTYTVFNISYNDPIRKPDLGIGLVNQY